jgi:hypothetical protein
LSNSSDSYLSEAACCISQPAPTSTAANICENSTSVPPLWPNQKLPVELAPERHHPRRTGVTTVAPNRCSSLVRQSDRKVNFVDSLVGKINVIIT